MQRVSNKPKCRLCGETPGAQANTEGYWWLGDVGGDCVARFDWLAAVGMARSGAGRCRVRVSTAGFHRVRVSTSYEQPKIDYIEKFYYYTCEPTSR